VFGFVRLMVMRAGGWCGSCAGQRVGGDLAAGADVLLSAQGMPVAAIARVAFTSEDRVRDVIRNFNADGFSSLYPKYRGGHPPKFILRQRREVKKIARSRPAGHDLLFSVWSLSKLADFLVAEGVVDDIRHEGLRTLLRREGVSFPAGKDPEDLQARATRRRRPAPGTCMRSPTVRRPRSPGIRG
jgi:transposase